MYKKVSSEFNTSSEYVDFFQSSDRPNQRFTE